MIRTVYLTDPEVKELKELITVSSAVLWNMMSDPALMDEHPVTGKEVIDRYKTQQSILMAIGT